MTRIVLVGAGSVEFTRNLLGDILSYPELRDAEIVLHDIDPDRLRTAERMAAWTAGALGATPDDRGAPRPPRGADRRRLRDQHHPGRRRAGDPGRLRHPGPLRPALHHQRHHQRGWRDARPAHASRSSWASSATWRSVCPDAWFLNYTNPMAMLVRARRTSAAASGRSACATPCSGRSTGWPATWACRASEVDHVSAGVNHLAFLLRLEHRGRDLYPDLRAFVDAGRVPDDDLVRAELFRRFGYLSHGVLASTTPSTTRGSSPRATRRAVQHPDRGVPDAGREQPRRVRGHEAPARRRRAVRDRAQRRVRGGDRQFAAHRRAGPDRGQRARTTAALIANLAADACVEVPALVDGAGV